jgi:membrane protease YdiL (CAAX protease family)
MKEFIIDSLFCTVIAAIVFGLSKLLRCKATDSGISQPRRSAIHAVIAVGISMSILFLLMLPQILTAKPPASTHKPHHPFALAPQIFLLALYAVPAGIFMFRDRENLRSVGISRVNFWQAAVIGVVLTAFTFYDEFRQGWHVSELSCSTQAIALVFYSFVGFGEEFLFRGYLQTRLVAWLGTARGLLSASFFMAFFHFPGRLLQGMGFLDSFVSCTHLVPVSLLMGFVMLQTGNLLAPGIHHTFMNWVRVISGNT